MRGVDLFIMKFRNIKSNIASEKVVENETYRCQFSLCDEIIAK